ncbi:3-oxoacyl-ACP reductase [Bifidobacterium leontopitheci]|uniref:3-ketoacyl-ACP reductase n=1 Tax=Bifidobacterium leontopitheci TaxID=2650774 RepID=A0A6I1GM64_9BIFI|nr:3-oxoacyl-ACP reductase [Bifidobacterium leontopitheci]KAB7790489.1 3-ketoacyl-ACP reductase [Bifidobacterium leontopitheci]
MTDPNTSSAINGFLNGETILVTGGARGLGEAITRAAVQAGAHVVVDYLHSESRAKALEAEFPGQITAIQADVTDEADVKRLFADARAALGRPITGVVNNALVSFSFNGDDRPKADTITWSDFEHQLLGAVKGSVTVIQQALPGFEEAGYGRVLNIGTNLFQNPVVPYHDYTAAKGALLAVTRTFAQELGARNVTVNMVSGGLLRTTDASSATPDAVFDIIAQSTPLGHVTTPQELADAALFFLSPLSRAVSGQNLIVDGGYVKG